MRLKKIIRKIVFAPRSIYNILAYRIKRFYWETNARIMVEHCGNNVFIGGPSFFSKFTSIGDNCNFNGFIVAGGGQIIYWRLLPFRYGVHGNNLEPQL